MTQELPKNAVLTIIDVQKGWDDPRCGRRNNPLAEQNMERLLQKWRATQRPVIFFQHLSKSAGSPVHIDADGCQIKDVVKPRFREPVFRRSAACGFIGTDVGDWLKRKGYQTLVMVGLGTMFGVSMTARMASDLGYSTYVVADASAAFEATGYDGQRYPPDDIHAIALATLHRDYATVLDTDAVLRLVP